MTISTEAPRVPVKACFRFVPGPERGLSGPLAGLVAGLADITANASVYAILPYIPLPPGQKAADMVAVLYPDGTRDVGHYPTLIKESKSAGEAQYAALLRDMEERGGYEVTPIEATQIDALMRRAERAIGDESPTVDDDSSESVIEVEDIVIEGTIGGSVGWTDGFVEDWA